MNKRLLVPLTLALVLTIRPALPADEKEKPDVEQFWATLKSLDAKTGSLKVYQLGDGGRVDHKLNLSREVKVLLDEKDGKLDDLKEGMRVFVQIARRSNEVVLIKVAGRGKEDGEKAERGQVRGVLKELDRAKNLLVLTIRRDGQPPTDETYALTKETRVLAGKKEMTLDDLKPGRNIGLQLTEDRKAVVTIIPGDEGGGGKRKPFELRGTLKAIDLDERTVTLTYPGEGRDVDRTFPLGKEPKVQAEKKATRLADLKPGERVRLQFGEDRKTVVGIFVGGDVKDKN